MLKRPMSRILVIALEIIDFLFLPKLVVLQLEMLETHPIRQQQMFLLPNRVDSPR